MTIRGGQGPRDADDTGRGRPPMARRVATANSATARPTARAGTVSAYDVARRRPRAGVGGMARFVIFLVVAAAVVLVGMATVLRPVTRSFVVGWADSNPGALGIPFVADFVREDLGAVLTEPASSNSTEVDFTVSSGETAAGIAGRLTDAGVLRDSRAFLLIAIEKGLTNKLAAGTYLLRRNLTPDQLVGTLLEAKDPSIAIQFRTGLRLEQMAAYLEARPPEIAALQMRAADFLALVRTPPASLLADYPWLDLPAGASLEGFLAGGSYRVLPDTTPEELVRKMLDRFAADVGPERLQAVKAQGTSLYDAVILASLVDKETADDAVRAKIAGVFVNRMAGPTETAGFLGSDPSVLYLNDSLQLAHLPITQWPAYTFWAPLAAPLPTQLPAGLAGYNTYVTKGLPPGPICTPTVASLDAALHPDRTGDYLYFLATKDGGTVFAKTYAEHLKNVKKYGA